MSTRAQIRIISTDGESWIDLYHHFDGYFSGVGKTLHDALQRESKDPFKFLAELMQDDESFEVTTHPHGDIEFWYQLDFQNGKFTGYAVCFPVWGHPLGGCTAYERAGAAPRVDHDKPKADLMTGLLSNGGAFMPEDN